MSVGMPAAYAPPVVSYEAALGVWADSPSSLSDPAKLLGQPAE